LIASYLNFELVNTQQHGFDAKIYIEVKQASSKKFEYHDDMRKSNAKHINIIHEYVVVYAKNKMQQTLFVMPNC
jgi:hypothetical protein